MLTIESDDPAKAKLLVSLRGNGLVRKGVSLESDRIPECRHVQNILVYLHALNGNPIAKLPTQLATTVWRASQGAYKILFRAAVLVTLTVGTTIRLISTVLTQ